MLSRPVRLASACPVLIGWVQWAARQAAACSVATSCAQEPCARRCHAERHASAVYVWCQCSCCSARVYMERVVDRRRQPYTFAILTPKLGRASCLSSPRHGEISLQVSSAPAGRPGPVCSGSGSGVANRLGIAKMALRQAQVEVFGRPLDFPALARR